MADVVVGLDGKPLAIKHGLAPVDEVVASLEDMLAAAKRGEVRAIGIAAVFQGHTTSTVIKIVDDPVAHELMAAITYLQFRYAKQRAECGVDVS